MTSYKTCAVSMCRSTTVKYPDKLFIHVPKSLKRRKLWLQLARRDPNLLSDKSPIFFCQDHFDLPNDMENYIQYSVMGSVGKIRMKPDCLPSKLSECHLDGIKPEVAVTLGATTSSENESATGSNFNFKDQATQVCPAATNQYVQVCLRAKIRSKAVQCTIPTKDKSTSLTNIMYSATSPYTCGVESGTLENTKVKSELLLSNENLGASYLQLRTHTLPSSPSLLVYSNQETQCELSEIQRKTEREDLCQLSTDHTIQLIKNNSRYYTPDTERDQSILVKMEVQEDGPRVPQLHQLLSSPTRPRGTRLSCVPMKVTSGPSPKFQVNQPPQLNPAFMLAEIKSEAVDGSPSGDDTLSCDEEPDQTDDSQPTEDLVPLSAHPVPLSNAPDPLCDVQVKREEEEGEAADGRGGEEHWAVKEEGRTVQVRPTEVVADSESRVVRLTIDNLYQTHKQEQKIKNLTRQREQLRLKVRKMRELIRRRDAKILKLQARLEELSSTVTQHHGDKVEEAAGSCGDAATKQIQSVKPDERKKKANRVLYVVNGADRSKSAQSTSHIRPKPSAQSDADILQQSLIGVLDRSEIRQETLLAVENTDAGKKTLELVVPQKPVSVEQKLDIRKNPSLVIQPITDIPKKPSTGTKRKLIVVKAKSVAPQIGSKRKSDIRQNLSIVIHPKLDIRQKVASDIPQTSIGLQRPSDIRQNGLVIQIDGMHSTVLQPKLVRLEDNNMDLG